jgi:CRP-like cAMP-binding protein
MTFNMIEQSVLNPTDPVEARIRLARRLELLEGLSESELRHVAERTITRRLKANDIVFHEGDPGHAVYFVLSGAVDLLKMTASGETVSVGRRGPGDLMGWLAAMSGTRRVAQARAATPCELLVLDERSFRDLLGRVPGFSATVMARIALQVRQTMERTALQNRASVLARTAHALLELSEAHAGTCAMRNGAPAPIRFRLNQRCLAESAATTRESVSRALRHLKNDGILASEGHTVAVLDLPLLRAIAQM